MSKYLVIVESPGKIKKIQSFLPNNYQVQASRGHIRELTSTKNNRLGIDVNNDTNGCLQDIHWSSGLFGYFPTYCLGNIYSAQFFEKAKKDIPDLDKKFESGDFMTLRNWLRENIHRHGKRYRANDLCKKVTGSGLSHKPLMAYMNNKFGEIYGF